MENLILYGALGLLTLLLIIALILLGTQRRRFTRDLEAQRDELLDALEQERDDHQRALRALNENLMHSLSTLGQSQSALLESMQRQSRGTLQPDERKHRPRVGEPAYQSAKPADHAAAGERSAAKRHTPHSG